MPEPGKLQELARSEFILQFVHTTQPSDKPFSELQPKLTDNVHIPHDVSSTENDHSARYSAGSTNK